MDAATYATVRLKGPAGSPTDYTGVPTSTAGACTPPSGTIVSCSDVYARVDVTAQLQSGGSGVYTFGNVGGFNEPHTTNRSGGWALLVQYDVPTEPMRTLVVLDGMVGVDSGHPTETVALGLLGGGVPTAGVKARVGLVAWDGDYGVADSASMTSGAAATFVAIADALNAENDVFNSTIGVAGVAVGGHNPQVTNTLGFDADAFDVTVYGGGPMTLKISTTQDAIKLGVITLSVPA